ncbi:filamentous hemagglutinin N-terminal domain-containing protein [Cyanobacteria bacterium FACHB-63]|nr:filamentous hemagglutinin N-terminal domain-containing protein [Cyanobacteria bacterium FACHB-63]
MKLKPLVLSFLLLQVLQSPAQAQITPASDGTNTSVDALNITGGTLSGNNLFHSFQTFGVDAGQTATFQSSPAIQNILGRVVGGNPSVINGAIQVIGGNSNLYLINPAGIIFGQGASLNVTGAFTATTANAIGFGDGKWFNAVGTNNYSALVGNPGDFAFTNQPGSIFNAANLIQKEGQSITLVGGTVVSTGTISAPGGKITIATVPGNQLVRISDSGSVLSLELPIASQQQINALPFTPLSLPALLTGKPSNEATGVTVENGVVKLTGSGQAIASGDIATNQIDTSTSKLLSGGNVSLHAQTNLSTGVITTGSSLSTLASEYSEAEQVTLAAILNKTTRGGDVKLSSQTGDITVAWINTGTGNFSVGGKGGNVEIKAAGLFRAIGFDTSNFSIRTSGNVTQSEGVTNPIGANEALGTIAITHSGTSFVTGGITNFNEDPSRIDATLITPFIFPEDASGTRGAIGSTTTNGNFRVVFKDSSFFSSPANLTSGFSITAVPRPNRPDPQTVQRQFTRTTGDQCDTRSTAVASNNSTPQRGTTTSSNSCAGSSTEGNVLQVVDK